MTNLQHIPIINIGTTGDYRPFSFYDDHTDKFTGFDIELIELICNHLRIRYDLIKTSWPTMENDLENDIIDMAVGGISLTQSRRDKFLTTQPIIYDGKIPITNQVNKGKFNTIADIDTENVRVIVNPGGTNEAYVRANLKKAQIILYENNNLIFDKIILNEADVMITDRIEALYHQSISSKLWAINPHKLLTNESYGYIFNSKNLALKNLINNGFLSIKRTLQFFNLYRKYFGFLPMMITVI